MKIQYASDLHLELSDNSRLFKHAMPFEAIGDVLVLAGDSMYLESGKQPCRSFWQWASENFQRVLMIPGNHEFYHSGDVAKYGDSWHNEIFPNVSYHQNEVVRIGDTDFILSTLWSYVAPQEVNSIFYAMSDFRQIRYEGEQFTTDDVIYEHMKAMAFIKKSVSESNATHKVVVTHHLPTFDVVAPRHKSSPISSAFATELKEFIADSGIDLWIYGHSHTNIDTVIGNTRIVSNQLGYVSHGEHLCGFSGNKYIEL